VGERADQEKQAEQKLNDHAVVGIEVELVLRVLGPAGEKPFFTRNQEADGEGDQHDGLDDPLDDDHLDEGVVLPAHPAELGPQAAEVVRAARGHLRPGVRGAPGTA
jgi:hypothetical protein